MISSKSQYDPTLIRFNLTFCSIEELKTVQNLNQLEQASDTELAAAGGRLWRTAVRV